MKQNTSFYTVGRFLTYGELYQIKGLLTAQRIVHLVNEHGPHMGLNSGSCYYEVIVSGEDKDVAKRIIGKYKARKSIDRLKCPKCGHVNHKRVEIKSAIVKLYYMGTTLVQCTKCKKRFGI